MKILNEKPAKWDEDGSSFKAFVVVSALDEREIQEEMRFRCHCEHDCCGHVSQGISSIRPLSNGNFAVSLYGWRNI